MEHREFCIKCGEEWPVYGVASDYCHTCLSKDVELMRDEFKRLYEEIEDLIMDAAGIDL